MSFSHRVWVLTGILLAGFTFSHAQSTADELRRADKQFELYAYNLALKTYQSVVAKEPGNAYALARVGDCYVQLNRPDDALAWYDRATAQNEVKPEVLLNYGKAQMATGNYTSAKKWFLFYAEHNQEEGRHFAEICDYAVFNAGKEALYQAQNEAMNSGAADFSPAFYGKRVVFNSARTDMARSKKGAESSDWSGSAYNQLFVTQADAAGKLQKPAFLKSDLSNSYNEGPASFSADGKRVAFCKNNFVDGTRQIATTGLTMSLYTADVVDGDWVNIKAFPYNGSEYATGFPALSPDGQTLYFASNRPEGEGGWDVYSSSWTGKYWTTPTNLGKTINSKGNEITPYFDGKNLYFSSDYHLGFGGMDVFRAEIENGAWSKIFHLGPGINSARDDYGFVFNSLENIGYVTSNRPQGKGNEDIWQIRKKTDDFVVTVVDADQKPLNEAVIDFSNCKGGEFATNANGQYAFSVTAGQANCTAAVRKNGYRPSSVAIKSSGDKNLRIVLESDATGRFVGQVFDARNRKGLSDVAVRALPMPKGDVVTASTDKDGNYALVLEARKTYKLQYAKEGFSDLMMTLETGNAKPTNEISAVLLDDANAAVADAKKQSTTPASPVTYDAQPKQEKQQSKSGENVAEKSPAPKPVEHSTAPAETPVLKALKETPKLANGWSIQISAPPGKADELKLAKYDNLRTFGNIYTQSAGKSTKIRLGVFEHKADAESILKKVLALNYKGAFVTPEKDVDEKLMVYLKPKEIAQPMLIAPKKEDAPKPETYADKAEQVQPKMTAKGPLRFSVQVASLKNDETVNLEPYMKITDIGFVYSRPENDVTKIRVGVWESAEDADAAHEAIVKRGFRDAIVVTEKSTPATERFLIKKETAKKPQTTTKGAETIVRPVQHSIEAPKPATSIYKVRLATYEDPDNFDARSAQDIPGKLERQKSGKLTIFLLGGYADLEAALTAKNAAREAGFKDAHVVKDEKGKLTKLKF